MKKKTVKKLKAWFMNLKLSRKIQLIAAVTFTAVLLITIPVRAWFAQQRTIAELQMIKMPDLLYLTAANVEAVRNFEMSGLDVEGEAKHKLFPFCVAGDYVSSYVLQLAHTWNNPFDYVIYEGTVYTNKADIPANTEYVEYYVTLDFSKISIEGITRDSSTEGATLYIAKGNALSGSYLNKSEGEATNKYLEECYGTYDKYTKNELPMYWQSTTIRPPSNNKAPFFTTYLIDVSWDGKAVINNKETDIVYLMAFTGSN